MADISKLEQQAKTACGLTQPYSRAPLLAEFFFCVGTTKNITNILTK